MKANAENMQFDSHKFDSAFFKTGMSLTVERFLGAGRLQGWSCAEFVDFEGGWGKGEEMSMTTGDLHCATHHAFLPL